MRGLDRGPDVGRDRDRALASTVYAFCVLLRRPVYNSMSDDAMQFNYAYARRPFEVLHCPSDL